MWREEVDEVADVDDVDANDLAALDDVAVAAAVEEAIALIDMKPRLKGAAGAAQQLFALLSPLTRRTREAGAANAKMLPPYLAPNLATNHHVTRCMLFLPARMTCGPIAIGARLL